ncbi:MAG: insulinase family protein [Alphaproteobacteria bacterium]|nr:insulinase family protein [Alphaproteobacteria bacterium]MCB9792117.1 insulinase family protein [Alphaproteobacteria bacterium]
MRAHTLMNPLLLGALAISACGEKTPPEPAAVQAEDPRFVKPAPLERKDFTLPEVHSATLSNGVVVNLVENHELPVVDVRITFRSGGWTDPADKVGLASATFDMLNEGAGGMSSVQLSAAGRKLATGIGSSAGLDSASVSVDVLKKNLEPALDLWATVLLKPDFPAAEWDRLRKQRVQNITASKTDPNDIAGRVYDRLAYGDQYDGLFETEASLAAISAADMKAWYTAHVVPADAMILVGGDITIEEIVPLLEARLGGWTPEGSHQAPTFAGIQPEETVIHLVDKPGAAQSVIIGGRWVKDRTDPSYSALAVGNTIWGGMFMSRLNMNLREDKGYTYGARSYLSSDMAGTQWRTSTSVKSDTTADALQEILTELSGVGGERALTADELAYFKSSLVNGYASRFETTGYLLGQQAEVWRYGLPEDWLSSYLDRVDGVNLEAAQGAFQEQVASAPLSIVVVGDLASIRGPIEALGLATLELDVDGAPVKAAAE